MDISTSLDQEAQGDVHSISPKFDFNSKTWILGSSCFYHMSIL